MLISILATLVPRPCPEKQVCYESSPVMTTNCTVVLGTIYSSHYSVPVTRCPVCSGLDSCPDPTPGQLKKYMETFNRNLRIFCKHQQIR